MPSLYDTHCDLKNEAGRLKDRGLSREGDILAAAAEVVLAGSKGIQASRNIERFCSNVKWHCEDMFSDGPMGRVESRL